jgi:hypothetical protein
MIFKGVAATLIALFLLPQLVYGQMTSHTSSAGNPEATVVLNEQFFNSFLDAIFDNLRAPSAPLVFTSGDRVGSSSGDCLSVVVLERQDGHVRTAVKLEQGTILAPLVFSGAYNSSLLGCLEFRGWASTEWRLEFDRNAQVLQARISILDLQLEGVPSLARGTLTRLVQGALDQQINPLKLLRVDQISGVVPIAPAGGSLRLRAKEIGTEVRPGSLYLRVTYEFLPEADKGSASMGERGVYRHIDNIPGGPHAQQL